MNHQIDGAQNLIVEFDRKDCIEEFMKQAQGAGAL